MLNSKENKYFCQKATTFIATIELMLDFEDQASKVV